MGEATGELWALGAVEAVRAMRAGDIRAEDYATALLDREKHWRHLNAFLTLDPGTVLEAARERGRENGQIVGVVAEAGTGKSRLCFEFVERCRARRLPVYEAHALAHGKQMPLLPVLELYRRFFGIGDRDPDRLAREKIAGRLLLLDDTLREELPVVFDMLGVADPANPLPVVDPEDAESVELQNTATAL